MFVDLPLAQLRDYSSSQVVPHDFDEFWRRTLHTARESPVDLLTTRVDTPFHSVEVYDVSFRGWAGERIAGWLRLPRTADGPLPGVVQYLGYSGARGAAIDDLFWASSGFAHLVLDTRDQGGGVMTRGIERRDEYYYRRVYTDAVRAVDALRSHPRVDPACVSVLGTSQGGGIALAVAGLVPDLAAVSAFVPFLSDFPRALRMTDNDPYKEIGRYLATNRSAVDRVMDTLAYFDAVNFSRRSTAPAQFSVALMDATCPPSTVFGSFNAYAGDKSIAVWEFNGHEGGGSLDQLSAWQLFSAQTTCAQTTRGRST